MLWNLVEICTTSDNFMNSTTGVVLADNVLAATVSPGAVPPMHTPSKHFPSYYTG